MPTTNITTTCVASGGNYTCTTPMSDLYQGNTSAFNTPFYSAGETMISLELLIIIIIGITLIVRSAVSKITIKPKHEI